MSSKAYTLSINVVMLGHLPAYSAYGCDSNNIMILYSKTDISMLVEAL